MSVLRFILFTHTQIYSPRFTRFSLSFSVCLSLLQANLTREIKANILVESARALFSSLVTHYLSLKARLRSSGRVGTAYFDCLLLRRRRLSFSSSNTDGSSSRRFS